MIMVSFISLEMAKEFSRIKRKNCMYSFCKYKRNFSVNQRNISEHVTQTSYKMSRLLSSLWLEHKIFLAFSWLIEKVIDASFQSSCMACD